MTRDQYGISIEEYRIAINALQKWPGGLSGGCWNGSDCCPAMAITLFRGGDLFDVEVFEGLVAGEASFNPEAKIKDWTRRIAALEEHDLGTVEADQVVSPARVRLSGLFRFWHRHAGDYGPKSRRNQRADRSTVTSP